MGEFYTLSRTNKSMPSKSFQFTSFDIFLHNLSKLLNVFPFNHISLYYSSPQCYFPTQHTVSNGYHRDVLHVFVIWTKTTRMFAENNNLPNPSCFLCASITEEENLQGRRGPRKGELETWLAKYSLSGVFFDFAIFICSLWECLYCCS